MVQVVYDRLNVISIGYVLVNSTFLTRQKCVNKQWDYGWGDLLGQVTQAALLTPSATLASFYDDLD